MATFICFGKFLAQKITSMNHRSTKFLRLERTCGDHLVQPLRRCRTLFCFTRFLSAQFSSLSGSPWIATGPSRLSPIPHSFVSSAKLLWVYSDSILEGQVINRDAKHDSTKYSWGYCPPAGLFAHDENAFRQAIQPVFSPLIVQYSSPSFIRFSMTMSWKTVTKPCLKSR